MPAGRDVAAALSLANLCWLQIWIELFFLRHSEYYIGHPAGRDDYLAACLGVGLLASLFLVLLGVARRLPAKARLVTPLVVVAVLLIPLNVMRVAGVLPVRLGRLPSEAGFWGSLALLFVSLMAISAIVVHRDRLAGVVRLGLGLLFPFAVLMLCRSAWAAAFAAAGANPLPSVVEKAPVRVLLKERLVWLLFDELDQGVAFARRPVGLDLPALDRLRSESIFLTEAHSPASRTLLAVPALLSGRSFIRARPHGASDLMLWPRDGGNPVRWSREPSVFSRAREAGGRTAIVGWYHPYCRIFARSLDACDWEPSFETALGRHPGQGLLHAFVDQAWTLSPTNRRRLAIESYLNIHAGALRAVARSEPGLSFVHYSIPHAPAIFDRGDRTLSQTIPSHIQGFLGNVELADRAVAEIRRTMEASGTWQSTTVLVTSDHPWRESDFFDGRHDPRVPFVLKMANQNEGLQVDRPFDTIHTAELVSRILSGELEDARAVAAWMTEAP